MIRASTSNLLIVMCAALTCGDDAKRPLGGNCADDSQCVSNLCLEARCLDPEADDDLDGLANRIEGALGTSPSDADSDGDGVPDGEEVGPVDDPRDFDGDGRNDAIESAILDRDGDCLVDERDPEDDDPKLDPARLAELGCCCDERCSLAGPAPTASCVDGVLRCDGLQDPCSDAICLDACAKVGARPDSDEPVCPDGAPVYRRYPTPERCVDTCKALGGFGQVAFLGCSLTRACSDDEGACLDPRDPPSPGCTDGCGAFADKCPDHALADLAVCPAFCSGVAAAIPNPSLDTALACIEALPECPADEASALTELLRCIAGVDERCVEVCTALAPCTGGAIEECSVSCTNLVLTHPERIAPTFDCIERVTTCDELSGCLPADIFDVCTPACRARIACDPEAFSDQDACERACITDLEADPANLAARVCEVVASSCDVACDAVAAAQPPEPCTSACADADDTCIEAAYGVCPHVCQGALAALGVATNAVARCVVGGLGRRCDIDAARSCVAP